MRITLLSHFPGQGGSTSLLIQLRKFFEGRGHEVRVVVGSDSPNPQLDRYEVFRGPPAGRGWRMRFKSYREFVEAAAPDVVYLVSGVEESDLLRFLRMPRVRHTFTLEQHLLIDVPYWLRQLAPYWEAVTANTPDVVNEIERMNPGCGPGYFLPYWLEPVFYEPIARPAARSGPIEVCYIGRLDLYQKRVDWIPEVVRRCRGAGLDLKWHLYGAGPAEEAVRRGLATRGCADLAEFHGWVESRELARRIRAHDICFNCSAFEGLPVALLEAMFCGLACVAPDLPGGVHYVVENGGVIGYRTGSIRTAVEAMVRVARDREELANVRRRTREIAERLFGLEVVERQYGAVEAMMRSLRFNGRAADLDWARRTRLVPMGKRLAGAIYRRWTRRLGHE